MNLDGYEALLGYLLLFLAVGIGFILVHLIAGKLLRPVRPDTEKQTIYECGEPTIGSAWIQFDLRFYVVALLFVIFDVEVAFFFPWAVVFGKANALSNPNLPEKERSQLIAELIPSYADPVTMEKQLRGSRAATGPEPNEQQKSDRVAAESRAAKQLAWFAFIDILIFFGVLLVGFAYLWKRGDLDWVRSTVAERIEPRRSAAIVIPPTEQEKLLASAASH